MNFVFQEDNLTKYLICRVCSRLFQSPMRLDRCGHTFCEQCIQSKICSLCSKPFKSIQVDLTAAGLIADMIVRCKTEECPFRGTYEEYTTNHQNKCRLQQCGGLENWKIQLQNSLSQFSVDKEDNSKNEKSFINKVKPEFSLQKEQVQYIFQKANNNQPKKESDNNITVKSKLLNNKQAAIMRKHITLQNCPKIPSKRYKQEIQIIEL